MSALFEEHEVGECEECGAAACDLVSADGGGPLRCAGCWAVDAQVQGRRADLLEERVKSEASTARCLKHENADLRRWQAQAIKAAEKRRAR